MTAYRVHPHRTTLRAGIDRHGFNRLAGELEDEALRQSALGRSSGNVNRKERSGRGRYSRRLRIRPIQGSAIIDQHSANGNQTVD